MTKALDCLDGLRGMVLCDGTVFFDDVIGYIGEYIPVLTDDNIHQAVNDWCEGGKSKENIEAMYGHISKWDVSNVTNMYYMFTSCSNFNQDISGWDVGNVISMHMMFPGCSSFNQDISNWNVSNVTDMHRMFHGCSSFDQDLSNWDVSNVTDMSIMFNATSALSDENKCAIHLTWSSNENWNYDWVGFCNFTDITQSNIQTAVDLWVDDNASALSTYGPIAEWDVSSVTSMFELFKNTGIQYFGQSLEGIDIRLLRDKDYKDTLSFVDQEQGWIVGDGGFIFATKDGGKQWQAHSTIQEHGHLGICACQFSCFCSIPCSCPTPETKDITCFYRPNLWNLASGLNHKVPRRGPKTYEQKNPYSDKQHHDRNKIPPDKDGTGWEQVCKSTTYAPDDTQLTKTLSGL